MSKLFKLLLRIHAISPLEGHLEEIHVCVVSVLNKWARQV